MLPIKMGFLITNITFIQLVILVRPLFNNFLTMSVSYSFNSLYNLPIFFVYHLSIKFIIVFKHLFYLFIGKICICFWEEYFIFFSYMNRGKIDSTN